MGTASSKAVATRLGIRPGHTLYTINAPSNYPRTLGQLPPGAAILKEKDLPADRVHLFAGNQAELDRLLPSALEATKPGGALWVSYPKMETGRSDLSRQAVHDALRLAGWKPVAVMSFDEVWSAIRARPATPAERAAL